MIHTGLLLVQFLLDASEVELCHRNPGMDPDAMHMAEDGFLLQLQGWCSATGREMPAWRPDAYTDTFAQYGITKRACTRIYKGDEWNAPMLFGLRAAVPPLAHFLLDANEVELCRTNPALDHTVAFMTEDGFIAQFRSWCKATGHATPMGRPDRCQSVFREYGITRLVHTRLHCGAERSIAFLLGLRVALPPLAHFLLDVNEMELCHTSPALDRSQTFMDEDRFVSHFEVWCKATGREMPPWTPVTYEAVFVDYSISRYEGAEWTAPFLVGMRLAER